VLKLIRLLGIKLLIITNLFAKGFYISFEVSSFNNVIVYSNFFCSEAMINRNFKKKFLFSLECKKNIKSCCYKHKNFIMDFLFKRDIYIFAQDLKSFKTVSSYAKLTYLPHLFDIILKNNRLYFYIKDSE